MKRTRAKKIVKYGLLSIFGLTICVGIGFGIYLAAIPSVPLDLGRLDRIPQVTRFLDADDREVTGNLFGKHATFIPIEELPETTADAFLSTEDRSFYKHKGLDYRRIFSAGIRNLTNGNFSQGASTVTQQLAKNTHLTFRKTIERKIQEMRLARAIERHYTKDEILEKYLNVIYFGHNVYGIESAAQYYFDKSARDLTLSESATLAAVINAPTKYSPILNPNASRQRRNLVIDNMVRVGKISDDIAKQAKAEPIELRIRDNPYGYYLASAYHESERAANGELPAGSVIRTNLHRSAQLLLNEALPKTEFHAKMILRNAQGSIIAAAGTSQESVGLKRQPGSCIKPILSYAPAIERGIAYPATPILDEPIDYGGYRPANYGGKHLGWISTRDALAHSNNIAAVKLLEANGIDNSVRFAQKVGLDLDERDRNHAAALGGLTYGVTLENLTACYSTFARHGITPADGYCRHGSSARKVMKASTADLVTDMLRTCAQRGTASQLNALPFSVAAKTGTVGAAKGGNRDSYQVSYTPDYTLGIWIGTTSRNMPNEIRGGTLPIRTAKNVWNKLYTDTSASKFDYILRECRLDRSVYLRDKKIVAAPDFLAPKDTFTEVFPLDYLPPSPEFVSPQLHGQRVNGAVRLEMRGDGYAEYFLIRRGSDSDVETPVGKLPASVCYEDTAVSDGNIYEYELIALYPNGLCRRSSPVKIMT